MRLKEEIEQNYIKCAGIIYEDVILRIYIENTL